MAHFFEKRDRWGNGYGLWILVAMAFLTPLALWFCGQIHLENRVESWLPAEDPQAKILDWSQAHFPPADRLLISWEGSSVSDPRLAAFERQLEGIAHAESGSEGKRPEIENVISPQDVFERMLRGGIGPELALDRLTGILIGRGPLRVRLSPEAKARQHELEEQLVARGAAELGLAFQILFPSEPVSPPAAAVNQAPIDSTVETAVSGEKPEPQLADVATSRRFDFSVEWPQMHTQREREDQVLALISSLEAEGVEEAFFQAGSPAALGVAISYGGRRRMSRTMDVIHQAAAEAGIPRESLRIGGGSVVGNELNEGVKKAFWNRNYPIWQFHRRSPLFFSTLVGMVMAFFMLRSVRLAMLVLIVANFTVLLTVALVPITSGSMNVVLVCMPTLLSVLTLSGAIHVANYWKHAALKNPRTAIVETFKMARQPCALASITTAVGLMSLTTSPLSPVKDFGFYAAIGCLISLVVVLYCLPAMLQFWPGKVPSRTEVDHEHWKKIAYWLCDHWKSTAFISIAFYLVCSVGLIHFRTETKVIRYFPDTARVVQDYDFLEENLSGIVPVEVIVRFDEESQHRLSFAERRDLIAEVSDKIRSHPEISGTVSLADFLKFESVPEEANLLQRIKAHRRPNEIEKRIKNGEETAAQSLFTVVREPASLATIAGRRFSAEAGDELWRITAQAAIMSDLDYADLTGDWTNPRKNPGALNEIVQSVLRQEQGTHHVITGMVPLFLKTQQAVLQSLIVSFGMAFVLIGLIMSYLLKHPVSGLLTMIPNVMPIGMIFGLISWGGIAVDIGTMITASVALGIAVDGTLHLLTWYRQGLVEGKPRREAIAEALVHCGPALWQTSAAVGIGLLMMYPAELLLISRFGWLMAALIASALVADLVMLPVLLAGPLGTIIERTIARQTARQQVPVPELPLPAAEVAQPQHGHLA